jgi:hypothetical protein
MRNNLNINPRSEKWLPDDEFYIAHYFTNLGFSHLYELMPMRLYDLMNMNGINPIKAEEIIVSLYRYLKPEQYDADNSMRYGFVDQMFDYREWRRNHKALSAVTVQDIVCEDLINLEAIYDIIDAVKYAFFRSNEYNSRRYLFANRREYLTCLAKRRMEAAHE